MQGFLEIGMKVSIGIRRDDKEWFFSSKVEDIKHEHIDLSMPMKSGQIFFVGLEEKVFIYFTKRDSFYCLEGKVENRQFLPIPIITIKPLKPPYKEQKRSYFRLKVTLQTQVRISENDKWIKGYIQDISAGGTRFSFPKGIKKGRIIELIVPAISCDMIFKAMVLRTEKDTFSELNPYEIAVKFVDIEEDTRDRIVRFILTEQRKLRKKGLI